MNFSIEKILEKSKVKIQDTEFSTDHNLLTSLWMQKQTFPCLYNSFSNVKKLLNMGSIQVNEAYSETIRPIKLDNGENRSLKKRTRIISQNKVSCAVCFEILGSMPRLNEHFAKKHSGVILEIEEVANDRKINSRAYKNKLLIKKMCSESVGSLKLRYNCPSCDYKAKWPTELLKHAMVHAKIRPYTCPICGTSYKWSWDLGRHFSNAHNSFPNPYKKSKNTSNQMIEQTYKL